MKAGTRNWYGALSGTLMGTLGGLIGLGGAEFRLPVLIGLFKLGTLEAVILNKAMSLVVVAAALLFRGLPSSQVNCLAMPTWCSTCWRGVSSAPGGRQGMPLPCRAYGSIGSSWCCWPPSPW